MSTNDQISDSEFSPLLECCICFCCLCDSRMCPECYQPFCRDCVGGWLEQHGTCPYCRCSIHSKQLVKVHVFEQLIEVVQRMLADEIRNKCPTHAKQQLLMACMKCQQCVCVDCWYSGDHEEHKDQVVPLEIAYEQIYLEMKILVSDDIEPCDIVLRDKIKNLCDGKRDAATLLEIMKTMEELRIDD